MLRLASKAYNRIMRRRPAHFVFLVVTCAVCYELPVRAQPTFPQAIEDTQTSEACPPSAEDKPTLPEIVLFG